MRTSDNGRKFIEGFEGLILQAYDDHNDHIVQPGQVPIGVLTIGYGHTDAAGPPKVYVGQKITKEEADAFLAADLASVENEVNHLVKVPINQNQFDALVSFQFNVGTLGHSGNSLLAALNSKDYNRAAADFLMYDHAGGVKLPGLTRRRKEEADMFLSSPSHTSPTPSNVSAGAAAATVIVGTTTVLAASSGEPSPLIFLGIIAFGIGLGLIVHWFMNRKVVTNVV